MINDPIVREVHEIRAKLLAECGGDMHRYFERLREREKLSGHPIMSGDDLRRLDAQRDAARRTDKQSA